MGHAKSESVSIWARMRVPTGWGVVWDRPVRYVYEVATTRYLGDETEVGLTQMSSIGLRARARLERARSLGHALAPVARYKFGPSMHGWTVGLAISF